MSEKVFRTAIYCRLSKEDGDKVESNSIGSQRSICEEYIKKHKDLEHIATFVDDGYSGTNFERPDFQKMMKLAEAGKIDCIVCKDLSRTSRNYIEGGRLLQQTLPRLGIRFISVNDQYDSFNGNPQSDSFIIPFKNLINDTYAKDISVKIRTNLDMKRKKGDYVGAYTPYGYVKDPENHNHLIVDDYAADIVTQIFSMYKDGLSICRITDRLNELGILSPMEYKRSCGINYDTVFRTNETARWSYNAVHRVLTNEMYMGMMVQGKQSTPNYKVHELKDIDESDWIRVENTHEAIISYDDFMAVKTMLGRDMRSSTDDSNANVFSGFVFCGDCGQPMIRKVVPAGKKKYYYYVCSSNKRKEGCSTHSISVKELENAVFNAVKDYVTHVLDLDDAIAYINNLPSADRTVFNYEAQIIKIEEEIERFQKMKLRLYEDLSDGVINKKEYMDFRNQYTRLIEDRESALDRVKKESRDCKSAGNGERAWVAVFREYENIDEINRRVLMSLVDRICIYEDHRVEVFFRYRDEFLASLEYLNSFNAVLPERYQIPQSMIAQNQVALREAI
ncbi:MAG: recombinase family protein [Erysipelotrichaceae bacterium]|nr:recombinase family protein [Erysipelotrichaceae bacterium]